MKMQGYQPPNDPIPDLSEIIKELEYSIDSGIDALSLLQEKKHQRVVRTCLRNARRAHKIATKTRTLITKNQIYWAISDNDSTNGWIYPPDAWYAIIAQLDQFDAAISDMRAGHVQLHTLVSQLGSGQQ